MIFFLMAPYPSSFFFSLNVRKSAGAKKGAGLHDNPLCSFLLVVNLSVYWMTAAFTLRSLKFKSQFLQLSLFKKNYISQCQLFFFALNRMYTRQNSNTHLLEVLSFREDDPYVFFALQLSLNKTMNQEVASNMKGSTVKRNTSVSTVLYERGYVPTGSKGPGQKNQSYSDSSQSWHRSMQKVSLPPQRLHSTIRKSTNHFPVSTTPTSSFQPGYACGKLGAQKGRSFVWSPVSVPKLVQTGTEPIQKMKGGSW